MGTIFKALKKSDNKIDDMSRNIDPIIVERIKPAPIEEDHSRSLKNHITFPEEYQKKNI